MPRAPVAVVLALTGLLLAVAAPRAAGAETAGFPVRGKVLEMGERRPLADVAISVRDHAALAAVTDAEGRFELWFPEPGTYTLIAVALGADAPATLEVEVGPQMPEPIFYLVTTPILPTVVVRAERNPDRVGKTVIRGEELSQVPGSAGDPLKALQSYPGVAVANDVSSEPAVRGSRPGDNAYYVDFLPVGYLFHAGGLVSVFQSDLIDDFNLHSAAFGPEYTDVIGAVFDVALRNPRTDRLGGKINVSLTGADFLVESPVSQDAAFYFAARRSYLDLIVPQIEEDGVTTELPEYYDYQGKYLWNISEASRLSLHVNGAADRLAFNVAGDSETAQQEPILSGSSTIDTSYGTQALVWDARLGRDTINKLAVGHTGDRQKSIIGSAGQVTVETSTALLREQLRFKPTANHEAFVGGNYQSILVDLDLDIKNPLCTEFDPECDITSSERQQLRDRFRVNQWDAHVKDRWRVAPRWTLIGGVRYSTEDYLDQSYTEPRVGVEWEWSDVTLLTAGWGKHNQFPAGAQVIPEFGNPGLLHLRTEHSVLGLAQQLSDGWFWKTEAYYKKFDQFVVADPVLNYVNGGSGHAYGIELLAKKAPTTQLSGWLSVTLSRSVRENDATGETFPFDYDQPVLVALVSNYRVSRYWSLGAKWSYHTGTPYTPVVGTGTYPDGRVRPIYGPINSERLPDYHRLDLRVDRVLVSETWKLKTYFEVINAYAQQNVAGYNYNPDYTSRKPIYQLPLFFSFGVQAEF